MPPFFIDILFATAAIGLLALSLAVVLVKNPVRSILLLILSFLPTALVYVMLQAPFVGILQILVYAGAIMMLFVFVIMMINPAPRSTEIPDVAEASGAPGKTGRKAAVLGTAILALAGWVVIPPVYDAASKIDAVPVSKPGFGGLQSLAELVFRDPANNPFTISFELVSFLILVGIVAAINFSRRRSASGEPPPPPGGGAPHTGTP